MVTFVSLGQNCWGGNCSTIDVFQHPDLKCSPYLGYHFVPSFIGKGTGVCQLTHLPFKSLLFQCTNLNTIQRIIFIYSLYFIMFLHSSLIAKTCKL